MEKYDITNVNNKILKSISNLTEIYNKISDILVSSNKEEIVSDIDYLIKECENDQEILRSSIIVFIKDISGDNDINNEKDFDVYDDGKGLRIN